MLLTKTLSSERETVETQLADYYTDALSNPFVKEDTAQASPATLAEAFAVARKSLRLYEMLTVGRGRVLQCDGSNRGNRKAQC